MSFTLDASQLNREVQRAGQQAAVTTPKVKLAIRKISLDTVGGIHAMMPVLTGRARASWGQWTPGLLVQPNEDAKPSDAIYQDDVDKDLSITQGTNVPYVEALNAGHSKKAPKGFIDTTFDAAQDALDNAVDAIMREAL